MQDEGCIRKNNKGSKARKSKLNILLVSGLLISLLDPVEIIPPLF